MGRSIRLFLADGTSTGIITAEIKNWTGHVVTGPRSRLGELLRREEASRTGVYFLVGEDPETGQALVYVGESDDVGARLQIHSRDTKKDFFTRVALVTSKDQNLTKAHVRFLESHLIRLAQESGRHGVFNATAPEPPALPEADVSDMDFFIAQVQLILPVLGFEFLRPRPALARPLAAGSADAATPAAVRTAEMFALAGKRDGISARGYEVDGEFIVLAGARVRGRWSSKSSYESGYKQRLEQLLDAGRIVERGGHWETTEDLIFSSPSAAAAVCFGRSSNGREAWIHEASGLSYNVFQAQQLASTNPEAALNDP